MALAQQGESLDPGAGEPMRTAQGVRIGRSPADDCIRLRLYIVAAVSDWLSKAGIDFSADEIELFYRQACHGLFLSHQAGEIVETSEDFLADATLRRALEGLGTHDPIAETADERRELARVSRSLRERFGQDDLAPETLRVIYGLPAETLFVDRVEAELDSVIGGALNTGWCDGQASSVGRFALGAFAPSSEGHRDVLVHLKRCENCRRHVQRVRTLAAAAEPDEELFAAAAASGSIVAGFDRRLGAPRSRAPLSPASNRSSRATGKIAVGAAAIAAVLIGGLGLVWSQDGQAPPTTSAAPNTAPAAEIAPSRAADAERKAAAARKLRAERRAKRAAAKRRAAARRAARKRAAAAEAVPRTQARPTPVQPSTQRQTQPSAPAKTQKSQPKPSTDPSQEFGD